MTKISNLPADSSPTTTDVVPTVDVESNTTKKSTLANLITLFFNNIPSNVVSAPKIDFGGAGSGVWWEEIGRSTLGVAGDVLTVSSLPARKYLKIIVSYLGTGGTIDVNMRFNSDSGSNYAVTLASVGGSATTSTSQNAMIITGVATTPQSLVCMDVLNISAQEKLCQYNRSATNTAGASTAPSTTIFTGKWANTSSQISAVSIHNLAGTGDLAIGSEIVVLGHD